MAFSGRNTSTVGGSKWRKANEPQCDDRNWAALACSICVGQSCPQDQPKGVNAPVRAPQNSKVCKYDHPSVATQPSYWWQLLYELFKWHPVNQPPFRRSVAFLAGVSHYNQISQQLDFVTTDLTELRNFLLTDGGFDTVYEVRDGNVSHQVIEDFMGKYFSDPRGPVGADDRLLFYYSGHGGAQAEVEPYLLFQNANPPSDYTDALPVRDVYRWARTVAAKHLLIVLDSCFSGLARDKPGPEDMSGAISNALAGEPSGLLLTAGTGDEKAYAIQYSKQKNGSIFTHALIDALRSMSKSDGIITIGEAFEKAKVTVAAFDAVANRKMTPLPTPLPRRDGLGKGNFIFINPKAENPAVPVGIYGQQAAIAKAPDYVDPNLNLIQKEYDEVKNTSSLAALRAFVSTYKGKSYGQTLVSLIEEKISRIQDPPSREANGAPPPAEVTHPRDTGSDLAYLAGLAKARRLQELKGKKKGTAGNMPYYESTFVVTGADKCEVNENADIDHPYDIECYFSKLYFDQLLETAKSAISGLTWKSDSSREARLEDVDGRAFSQWVNVMRHKATPEVVHIYIFQFR